MVDGERLPLAVKDLGSSDLYPQSLQHNPNGRFVTVCGDGEYVVYTALAWRNKSFGQVGAAGGLPVAWWHAWQCQYKAHVYGLVGAAGGLPAAWQCGRALWQVVCMAGRCMADAWHGMAG